MYRLDRLKIENFRGIKSLLFDEFGRINLFVGRNSVGKTTVLDAIRIYSSQGNPADVVDLLKAREELKKAVRQTSDSVARERFAIENLFYGRKLNFGGMNQIVIDPISGPKLKLTFSLSPDLSNPQANQLSFGSMREQELRPILSIQFGEVKSFDLPLDVDEDTFLRRYGFRELGESSLYRTVYIPANGLDMLRAVSYWDQIALTEFEDSVLNAAKIIEPKIERISAISPFEGSRWRSFIVKLKGIDRPVPLKSLGDGITRLIYLAISLACAKGGVLILDEAENGIHYSIQADIWKFMFEMSKKLNVQVFATTHSSDCINAFAHAAEFDKNSSGVLYRIEREDENLHPVKLDESELSIVASRKIEVR